MPIDSVAAPLHSAAPWAAQGNRRTSVFNLPSARSDIGSRAGRHLPGLAAAPQQGWADPRAPGSALPERTPHALRHTYASLHIAEALEAGRDRDAILTYLRSQLRHRSIQTTMDYYIHLFPGGQREITNRLDDDTGQAWVPVVGGAIRPSRIVPKPSRSAKPSQSGSGQR
jgi:integrase